MDNQLTKQISERIRNRILIRYLHENGMSLSRIKPELKISEPTIRRWISRDTVCGNPRSGRPTEMTPDMAKMATEFLKEKRGASLRACSRALSDEFPTHPISHISIRAWSLK